jgi:hypothetical protein
MFQVLSKKQKIDSRGKTCLYLHPMTTMATNYLQMLPYDISEQIYQYYTDSVTDEIDVQVNALEKRVNNCFLKKVRATSNFPAHLIMDGFFHINPDIDISQKVFGPILAQFDDLFYKSHTPRHTTSLTITSEEVTVKDILVQIIKHIGRFTDITQYHDGCYHNCIQSIYIYDEDPDSDDEDGQHSDVKSYISVNFDNNIRGNFFRPKLPKPNGLLKIKANNKR